MSDKPPLPRERRRTTKGLRPLPVLARDLVEQLRRLIAAEFALFKAEMSAKAKNAGVGVGLFVGALVFVFFALAALVTTAVLAFALIVPPWARRSHRRGHPARARRHRDSHRGRRASRRFPRSSPKRPSPASATTSGRSRGNAREPGQRDRNRRDQRGAGAGAAGPGASGPSTSRPPLPPDAGVHSLQLDIDQTRDELAATLDDLFATFNPAVQIRSHPVLFTALVPRRGRRGDRRRPEPAARTGPWAALTCDDGCPRPDKPGTRIRRPGTGCRGASSCAAPCGVSAGTSAPTWRPGLTYFAVLSLFPALLALVSDPRTRRAEPARDRRSLRDRPAGRAGCGPRHGERADRAARVQPGHRSRPGDRDRRRHLVGVRLRRRVRARRQPHLRGAGRPKGLDAAPGAAGGDDRDARARVADGPPARGVRSGRDGDRRRARHRRHGPGGVVGAQMAGADHRAGAAHRAALLRDAERADAAIPDAHHGFHRRHRRPRCRIRALRSVRRQLRQLQPHLRVARRDHHLPALDLDRERRPAARRGTGCGSRARPRTHRGHRSG